jgi:hypothetical protein
MPGVPSGIHRWTDPRHDNGDPPVPNGTTFPGLPIGEAELIERLRALAGAVRG